MSAENIAIPQYEQRPHPPQQHTKNLYTQQSISLQLTISMLSRDLKTSLFCAGELYQSYGYEYVYKSILIRYILFYYIAYPFMMRLFSKKDGEPPDPGEILKQIVVKCKPDMTLQNIFSAISNMEQVPCDLDKLKAFKNSPPTDFTKDIYLLYHHPKGLETVGSIISKSPRNKRYISLWDGIQIPEETKKWVDYYFYGGEIYLYIHKYKKPKNSPETEPLGDEEMLYYKHNSACPLRRRMIRLHDVCFHPTLWGTTNQQNIYRILGHFWKDGAAGLSKYWQLIYNRKGDEAFEEWVVDKYGDHDEKWPLEEKQKSHNIIPFEGDFKTEFLKVLQSEGLEVNDLLRTGGDISIFYNEYNIKQKKKNVVLVKRKSFSTSKMNIIKSKNRNKGEKGEFIVLITLLYYTQTLQFEKLRKIFGNEACDGIALIDIETGEEVHDMNEISKAKSSYKADCKLRMNITGNIYTPSIKCKNGQNYAIINHTHRNANVFQPGGILCSALSCLDTIVAEYKEKRYMGIIREDTLITNLECLENNSELKEKLMEVLIYFVFNGTGKGYSKCRANSIIIYKNDNITFYDCMSEQKKREYIESIYDRLVLSLRHKGMPQTIPEYCNPWIYDDMKNDVNKHKGCLHIRVK